MESMTRWEGCTCPGLLLTLRFSLASSWPLPEASSFGRKHNCGGGRGGFGEKNVGGGN